MGSVAKWTAVLGVVIGLCSVLRADAPSDLDRAKEGYPDFTPVGETYTACRS